jgi:hypothetical protein
LYRVFLYISTIQPTLSQKMGPITKEYTAEKDHISTDLLGNTVWWQLHPTPPISTAVFWTDISRRREWFSLHV